MDLDKIIRDGDIQDDIRRIHVILNTDIFTIENSQHPLRQAAFTELTVCLADLLQKARKLDVPVSFTDDIPPDLKRKNGKPMDITDYIQFIRNTACHISSENFIVSKSDQHQVKSTIGTIYGKIAAAYRIRGEEFLSPKYEDDFCFILGKYMLYYNRQILRAFEEAKQNVLPLIS